MVSMPSVGIPRQFSSVCTNIYRSIHVHAYRSLVLIGPSKWGTLKLIAGHSWSISFSYHTHCFCYGWLLSSYFTLAGSKIMDTQIITFVLLITAISSTQSKLQCSYVKYLYSIVQVFVVTTILPFSTTCNRSDQCRQHYSTQGYCSTRTRQYYINGILIGESADLYLQLGPDLWWFPIFHHRSYCDLSPAGLLRGFIIV